MSAMAMNSLLSWQPSSTNASGRQTKLVTYHDWWRSKDETSTQRSTNVNSENKYHSYSANTPQPHFSSQSVLKPSTSSPQTCSFFLQGICRFGPSCRNLHPQEISNHCYAVLSHPYANSESSSSDRSSSQDAESRSSLIDSRDSFASNVSYDSAKRH